MTRKKLKHILEVENFENVFVNPSFMKGEWCFSYFKNDNPIVLELACGRGYYTLSLAEKFPDKNIIGVDKKGNRIWGGAKKALDQGIKNAAFIRAFIENLDEYFAEGEVSEIWITFPDPFLKPSKADRRLTSPLFLEKYRKVLRKDGVIHLKTDNEILFEYTLDTIKNEGINLLKVIKNLHNRKRIDPLLSIQTYYEEKFLKEGRKINYLSFQL